MSSHITKEVTGYCPHLKDEQEILLTYFEFHVSGELAPKYKKGDLRCKHADKCGKANECPVRAQAPSNPW